MMVNTPFFISPAYCVPVQNDSYAKAACQSHMRSDITENDELLPGKMQGYARCAGPIALKPYQLQRKLKPTAARGKRTLLKRLQGNTPAL